MHPVLLLLLHHLRPELHLLHLQRQEFMRHQEPLELQGQQECLQEHLGGHQTEPRLPLPARRGLEAKFEFQFACILNHLHFARPCSQVCTQFVSHSDLVKFSLEQPRPKLGQTHSQLRR